MDPIALRILRGQTAESVHRASVAVADASGRLLASFGDAKRLTFLRSAAKPFQMIPLIESGAADRFGFGPREFAISAGSHSGEPLHVDLVESMLRRIGKSRLDLQCGVHLPFDETAARRVGDSPTALHHNCSGLHAAMLAVCEYEGLDSTAYTEAGHPLQQTIRGIVAQETGLKPQDVTVAPDGCNVPTFAVPLRNGARAFARLARPDRVRGLRGRTLRLIAESMMANPLLVAGTDRLDTEFMKAFSGRLLVKAGAEACYGAGLPESGIGILLKVEDGSSRAVGPVLLKVLDELGMVTDRERTLLAKYGGELLRTGSGRPTGAYSCDVRLKFSKSDGITKTLA